MDVKTMWESFKVDLTCVLCLGYLTDPVTVKCGHTFCKECLQSYWKGDHTPASCPRCRKIIAFGHFMCNKRLQNLAIIGKMLRPYFLQSHRDPITCDTHGKEQTLFCEEDHRPLCGRCFVSPEHKGHKVLPLETAAGQCMEQLQASWNLLKQKKQKFQKKLEFEKNREAQWELQSQTLKETIVSEFDKIHQFFLEIEQSQLERLKKASYDLTLEENEDNSSQMMSVNSKKQLEVQARRVSIESEFQEKHHFLSEGQKLYLQSLDQNTKDNLLKFEESQARMTQQIHNLQMVMSETEKNFEKVPIAMLQDAKVILDRNKELLFQNPVIASPRWTMYPIAGMRQMLLSFHRDLTLDPDTADPHLLLSDDLKSVECVSDPQDAPDNPERFHFVYRVLASQSFTSGKHYWEVEVGNKAEWEVGICKSIGRKGKLQQQSKARTLLAFTHGNEFCVSCSPQDVHACQPIEKVGIFLDYERGHIAFYSAPYCTLICSPPNDAFQGPVSPCFCLCSLPGKSNPRHLRICPRNKK